MNWEGNCYAVWKAFFIAAAVFFLARAFLNKCVHKKDCAHLQSISSISHSYSYSYSSIIIEVLLIISFQHTKLPNICSFVPFVFRCVAFVFEWIAFRQYVSLDASPCGAMLRMCLCFFSLNKFAYVTQVGSLFRVRSFPSGWIKHGLWVCVCVRMYVHWPSRISRVRIASVLNCIFRRSSLELPNSLISLNFFIYMSISKFFTFLFGVLIR